jgi:hypothetical protein
METGSDNRSDRRAELATVSGAMPREPDQRRFDSCIRTCDSVGLPFPMVTALGSRFRTERRGFVWDSKRHEIVCEPMERRQGGGNDRRPELAAVSGTMPYAPRLRRRALGGDCAGGAGPSSSARLSVGLSVPMVAAVGSIFLIGRDRCSASGRIHDRTRGACAMSV